MDIFEKQKKKSDEMVTEGNPVSELAEEEGGGRVCIECGDKIKVPRDLQLCSDCCEKFDLDRLWELHDEGKLDALDFNRSEKMRDRFRKKKLNEEMV